MFAHGVIKNVLIWFTGFQSKDVTLEQKWLYPWETTVIHHSY